MTCSSIESIVVKGLLFLPKLLAHVKINLHYIIYHLLMKHDGVF